MSAAEVGVVEDDDVAGAEGRQGEGGLDGGGHGAEVDGDVGGLGDQLALGVEEGAGEVAALLDVGGEGGAAKDDAHLFSDGGEEGVEDGQLGRVGGGGGHVSVVARLPHR